MDEQVPIATLSLTAEDRQELLRLARDSVIGFVTTGLLPPYRTDNPRLLAPAAVFVTLRLRERDPWEPDDPYPLRGCIGQVNAEHALWYAVQEAAAKAATADPRFYPVAAEEVDDLFIEISVLSPMCPIHALDEIVLGTHGLLVVGLRRRGLLLPSVPLAFHWNAQQFVGNLCRKAGLPEDAWPRQARLYAFTTDCFKEYVA